MERKFFFFILFLTLSILHVRGGCNVISAFDIRAQLDQPIEAVCGIINGNNAKVSELDIRYVIYDMSGLEVIADGVRKVSCEIEDGATKELTVELQSIGSLLSGTYTLEVTSVDGEDNNGSYGPYEASIEVVEKLFDRVVICEEFTGNTCGWCPRGIEGMAFMREKYPDAFIGIGVHAYSASDPLYCESYSGMSGVFSSAPSCILDRKRSCMGDPFYDIENLFLAERNLHSFAKISMDGRWSDDGSEVILTTHSVFSRNERNCSYRVGFVVVENGVDRDKQGNMILQTNYYSGSSVQMNGWEVRLRSEVWTYDDVARSISGFNGLDESELREVETDYVYDFTYAVRMPFFLNRDNIELIAFLYDGVRNEIVNACKLDSGMQTPDAVVSPQVERPVVRQLGKNLILSTYASGLLSMKLISPMGVTVAETVCKGKGMSEVSLSVGNCVGVHLLQVTVDGHASTYKIYISNQ